MLGLTEKEVCSVKGLLPYMVLRGAQLDPFFITADNQYLTQACSNQYYVHSSLTQTGLSRAATTG